MNEMINVRINMDERWYWCLVTKFADKETTENLIKEEFSDNSDMANFIRQEESPSLKISEELFKEYQEATERYDNVMAQIEQLYRKQEGYTLRKTPELPEHRMLNENA